MTVGIILCTTVPGATESNAGDNYMIPLFPKFPLHQWKDILQPAEAESSYQMMSIQAFQKLRLPFRFHSQNREDTARWNFNSLCFLLSDQDFCRYFLGGSFSWKVDLSNREGGGRFNSLHHIKPEEGSAVITRFIHKIKLINRTIRSPL